jgi:nicotinamidase-related amidase
VTVTDVLDPTRTALLLMDYQNGILARYAGTDDKLLPRQADVVGSDRLADLLGGGR